MAASFQEPVPSGAYHPDPRPDPGASGSGKTSDAGKEPLTQNVAVLISVLVHGFAILFIGLSALLAPHRPSAVPVFELVNLEPPKLRPLTPKQIKPPEPPPPEPEPVKPPEAPKLTPKPTNAVQPKKPEPKVVKEKTDDEVKPVKEVVQEQQVLTPQIVSHVPADPRLSFWASRVKKSAELLWRPPSGIDISGNVKAVISFKVTREGQIQDVEIASGSGNADLDDLAKQTIVRLDHTPPIPENFPEDMIQVSYEFVYAGQQ
ncbi:MAG TPA: TonB family protein [Fibrobacteria bacterium]|nr:TonB family protein [Fibrobacteria bacterium]